MKYMITFIVGALLGAAVALMFAPTSGEEMRENVKTQVDAQSAKLQEQWQEKSAQMQAQINKMSSDLQALSKQSKEVEPAA